MTEARKIAINQIAEFILSQLHISAPLNEKQLKSLVELLGGTVKSDTFDKMTYGMIKVNGEDNFIITYNKDNSSETLFTIAHELGHYFLHLRDENGNLKDTYHDSPLYRRGISVEEDEANEFASALLMPKEVFNKYIDDNKNNQQIDLVKLANYFNVSQTVALNRGKSLGRFL